MARAQGRRGSSFSRRRWILLGSAAVLVVFVAAGLGVWLATRGDSTTTAPTLSHVAYARLWNATVIGTPQARCSRNGPSRTRCIRTTSRTTVSSGGISRNTSTTSASRRAFSSRRASHEKTRRARLLSSGSIRKVSVTLMLKAPLVICAVAVALVCSAASLAAVKTTGPGSRIDVFVNIFDKTAKTRYGQA